MHNGWLCLCVPGYIFTRTGQKRCKKSKYCCKMHHPRRQSIKSNMLFTSLCKMYRQWYKQTLRGVATMERFTQPIQAIFRLEIGRICVLSRKRITITKSRHLAGLNLWWMKLDSNQRPLRCERSALTN